MFACWISFGFWCTVSFPDTDVVQYCSHRRSPHPVFFFHVCHNIISCSAHSIVLPAPFCSAVPVVFSPHSLWAPRRIFDSAKMHRFLWSIHTKAYNLLLNHASSECTKNRRERIMIIVLNFYHQEKPYRMNHTCPRITRTSTEKQVGKREV